MFNDYEIRGKVAVIFLNRKDGSRFETFIDVSDLEKAKSFPRSWNACWDPTAKSFYVRGCFPLSDGKRRTVSLHRWLFNEPKGYVIDHINHDTLDNRRSCNLRKLKHNENNQNRNGLDAHNKSGVRGVSWHKASGKWRAQIKINNKCKHLGIFETKDKAISAMIEAQKQYHPYALAN